MVNMSTETTQIVFWHRNMPPLDAESVGEHVVEAESHHVAGTMSHSDELWDECYRELMRNVEVRLRQEISRLGGDYAHIYDESIDTRRNEAMGEAWLHGRFSYVLYRQASHDNATRPSVADPSRR